MIGLAVAMLAWFCGSVFGSLSVTSSERGSSEEEGDAARFNARLMLFFYALALLVVVAWGLLVPTR